MSIAEGYTISVQCDGTHSPGLNKRGSFYGTTKREAHAAMRAAGWRLGPDFTAYCRACKPPPTSGVDVPLAPSSDAAWVKRLRDTAKHLRENALSLAKYPGMADESRARELAALYIGEIAELFEAKLFGRGR